MRQRVDRLVTRRVTGHCIRRHKSFGSLAYCQPRRVSVRVERTVWSLVNTQGLGRRRSNDSFIAERREPPGRARLRVGCRIAQFELAGWFRPECLGTSADRRHPAAMPIAATSDNVGAISWSARATLHPRSYFRSPFRQTPNLD